MKALKSANAKERAKQEEKKEETKQEEKKQEEKKQEETKPQQQQSNNSTATDDGSSVLNGIDPEAIIWEEGLGEVISTIQIQLNDGNWYWEVDCKGADGEVSSYLIDEVGNVSAL